LCVCPCTKANNELAKETKTISVGTFGGSIAQRQTDQSKQIWVDSLKQDNIILEITTCAVGGAGFSSTLRRNVPWQIQNADTFDVYILWSSTNDVKVNKIGDIGTRDLITQSGGLLKSIELIKSYNDSAIIILFTSLPHFRNENGYLSTGRLSQHVDAQKLFCKTYNIPYLDQFSLFGLNLNNYRAYYIPDDDLHLTDEGYLLIAPMQAHFIRQVLKKNITL
jgi:lysophospholipase L1-like esterase